MQSFLICNTRGRALHGDLQRDSEISLRIALSGEKCERCQRVCEMFIEPAVLRSNPQTGCARQAGMKSILRLLGRPSRF